LANFNELLGEKSLLVSNISPKITKLSIYIYELNIKNDKKTIKNLTKNFSNTLYVTTPNIKDLTINFSYKDRKVKIPLIMSLLNEKWNLSNISFDLAFYSLCDEELIKIFDKMSSIKSLMSVKFLVSSDASRVGITGLKNIAQHSFCSKLMYFKLNFNPNYVDKESLDDIRDLFQKNMADNAKISLNNIVITKKQKKDSVEKITAISNSAIQKAKEKYTNNYGI
jgi:hypothetical protein